MSACDRTLRDVSKEAERVEEDSLFSSRGHLKAASVLSATQLAIGVAITALAAVAGTLALAEPRVSGLIAALALVSSALAAILAFTNPSARAQNHLDAGHQFLSLRNDTRFFREIDLPRLGAGEGTIGCLRELGHRRNALNSSAPQIPRWAYLLARRGIDQGEAEYDSTGPA